MSIRIQNDSMAGVVAPGVGRTDEVSHPSNPSSLSTGKTGSRGTADSVDISSLSQSVAAASTAQQTQQASRIKQLSALYASGQYSVDSERVSRAIVSQALGDGSSGPS